MLTRIRIATRESQLALWQANHVKNLLLDLYKELEVELVPMTTRGDEILDTPLSLIGGKGLFIKELEKAMYENRADIAVHSMKDVPMELPEGMTIGAILERAEPRDAFVSNQYNSLSELPEGSVVGSSSLRRQKQLINERQGLIFRDLRGNINTRLGKLDAGDYDAIILAACGLQRLSMEQRISSMINTDICLPAAGQAAIGIECLQDEEEIVSLVKGLEHQLTRSLIEAERALAYCLSASCDLPIAAYAIPIGDDPSNTSLAQQTFNLTAFVSDLEGEKQLRMSRKGSALEPVLLGKQLADDLLAEGAGEMLSVQGSDS